MIEKIEEVTHIHTLTHKAAVIKIWECLNCDLLHRLHHSKSDIKTTATTKKWKKKNLFNLAFCKHFKSRTVFYRAVLCDGLSSFGKRFVIGFFVVWKCRWGQQIKVMVFLSSITCLLLHLQCWFDHQTKNKTFWSIDLWSLVQRRNQWVHRWTRWLLADLSVSLTKEKHHNPEFYRYYLRCSVHNVHFIRNFQTWYVKLKTDNRINCQTDTNFLLSRCCLIPFTKWQRETVTK